LSSELIFEFFVCAAAPTHANDFDSAQMLLAGHVSAALGGLGFSFRVWGFSFRVWGFSFGVVGLSGGKALWTLGLF